MLRLSAVASLLSNVRRPNLLALIVAAGAAAFLYTSCDPTPAGAEAGEAINLSSDFYPPAPPMAISAGSTSLGASGSSQSSGIVTGRLAMLMNVLLLKEGRSRIEAFPAYSALMHKQERINGDLSELQTMDLKLRHEPFSVYMKWRNFDPGREVIYVDGENSGNMLVHPGGWKGKLTGTLELALDSALARAENRHPITSVGLLELTKKLHQYHEQNLGRPGTYQCEMHEKQRLNGRDCYMFVVTYNSPSQNPMYRKSIQYIDYELSLPICVKNFTWAVDADPETIDDETLIEFYSYSDLKLEERLADSSFDTQNEEYRFRR